MIYPSREYVILEGRLDLLESEVNRKMKEGWSPQGGLTLTEPRKDTRDGDIQPHFAQAMIRERLS